MRSPITVPEHKMINSLRLVMFAAVFCAMGGCASFPWQTPGKARDVALDSEKAERQPATLDEITIGQENGARAVKLAGSVPFRYISYKLEKPSRLAIEIPKMRSALQSSRIIPDDDDLIGLINVIYFERADTLRVEIHMKRGFRHDFIMDAAKLTVRIDGIDEDKDPQILVARLNRALSRIEELTEENDELKSRLALWSPALSEEAAGDGASSQTGTGGGEQVAQTEGIDSEDGVFEALEAWRNAWQDRDFEKYTGYYSESFDNNGKGRDGWAAARKNRFSQTGHISVKMEDLKISMGENEAMVEFVQKYSSERYKDTGIKTLHMVKTGSGWKIDSEEWRRTD